MKKSTLGFLRHVVLFIVGNILLFILNLINTPETFWFYWPLILWSIILVGHGLKNAFPSTPVQSQQAGPMDQE